MLRQLELKRQVLFALTFIVLIAHSAEVAAQQDSYLKLLSLARSYDPWEQPAGVPKDPHLAMDYYRQAIAMRSGDPEGMPLRVRCADLYVYRNRDASALQERTKELEEVLKEYKCMDYYDSFASMEGRSDWSLMISVAIHAGDGQQLGPDHAQSARGFYIRGMEMLNEIYERRTKDWLEAVPPQLPPDPHGGWLPGMKEEEMRDLELRAEIWKRRQESAKSGTVFETEKLAGILVESLVRKYVDSYGVHEAREVAGILQPIVERFSGSPLEKEAHRVIATADVVATH